MHTIITAFSLRRPARRAACLAAAVALLLAPATGVQAATIVVDRVITGSYSIPDGSTVTFKAGGKFKNCRISGARVRVVPGGTRTIFDNCTFAGSFSNSELSATNFGAVPDMDSVPSTWTYRTGPSTVMRASVYRYRGTDNGAALASMGAFCSNGANLTLHINGKFYTRINQQGSHNAIAIDNAEGVTIEGGTLLMGFKMWSCRRMTFKGISIVGETTAHDFPPIYYNADQYKAGSAWDKFWRAAGYTHDGEAWTNASTGERIDLKYLYNIKRGLSLVGLGNEAFLIGANPHYLPSTDITIEHCRVSMRTLGVMTAADPSAHNWRATRLSVTNCHFDHIYYQPIALHSGYNHIAHCTADYVFQPVDMSTYAHNTLVDDFKATRCGIGPKQENHSGSDESHDNELRNCSFAITDDIYLPDVMYEMLWVRQGRADDCFKLTNCKFSFTSTKKWFRGLMILTHKAIVSNCQFTINVKDPYVRAKDPAISGQAPDVNWIVNGYNAEPQRPDITLDNVRFVLGTTSRVQDVFFKIKNLKATAVTVEGNGTADNYFDHTRAIDVNKCRFDLPCQAIVAAGSNTASVTGTGNTFKVARGAKSLFPAGLKSQAFERGNTIGSQATAPARSKAKPTSNKPGRSRVPQRAVTSSKWHF